MLTLYRILTFVVYYITLPYTYIKHISKSQKWSNRLGFFAIPEVLREKQVIWFHASSMGEVKVLGILKDHLKRIDSSTPVFVTVMTESGYGRATELLNDRHRIGYLPLDYPSAIRRFMRTVNIRAAVFIETEIWPNIIHELGKKGTPLFLANGRLSEKSSRRYIHFRKALSRLFKYYRRFMVQSEIDRNRFLEIGAPGDRIDVIGSLKFDAPMNLMPDEKKAELRNSLPFEPGNKIFIAGSIRKGEDKIILELYRKLSRVISNISLILVPRHLERINELEATVRDMDLSCCRHSQLKEDHESCRVLIVDRMGILNELYAISDIAFVGGTLVDIGGHNILEPVWAGIPVLYGPSIENVRDSSEYIIENRFGEMVSDEEMLCRKLTGFFKGELIYNQRNPEDIKTSRAARTAGIILDNI